MGNFENIVVFIRVLIRFIFFFFFRNMITFLYASLKYLVAVVIGLDTNVILYFE
jgi:hypothetical protein